MAYGKMAGLGRIARRIRRVTIGLGALAALPLAVLATPAAAKPLTLTYLAYLAGFPVLSMTATADLPANGPQLGDGTYALNANIVTQGSLATLYPYRMTIASHGKLSRDRVQPGQFHSEGTIMSKSEGVTLTYHPGGKVDINAVPLTRQAQEAAANGTANGTIDPAALVIAVIAAYAERQACPGRFQLFDGVRRYDVAVQEVGLEQVAHHHRDAADPIDVDHVVRPVGLRVADVRHAGRNAVEVVEGEVDP